MRKLRTIEMNRLTLEEFKEAEKLPLIVVLDDVRSLYNVGSVFRSCDAFRVEAVYLCGITATPPNAEIHKTALGGEDSVDWEYFKTTEEAVEKLKQKVYFVYSIEQVEGSTKLQNLPEAHDKLFNQEIESGSGKSFFMNTVMRQYYEQDTDVVIVDTGDSYEGICSYFGGTYISYTKEKPISMNPFKITKMEYEQNFGEKKNFLKNLIFQIYKGANQPSML